MIAVFIKIALARDGSGYRIELTVKKGSQEEFQTISF